MNTTRIDISYRPLRIGWAIRSNDMDSFRQAVKLSYTLWGGRFNPIIIVDNKAEAKELIELFRVDLIVPIGESEDVKVFPKDFPHLVSPFIHDFNAKAIHEQVLNVNNMLAYLSDKSHTNTIENETVKLYKWQDNDPLADILLMQLGAYPSADEIGIDYQVLLKYTLEATEQEIEPHIHIPRTILDHISVSLLSQYVLNKQDIMGPYSYTPGFFVGSAENFDDLVCYWNLRAAAIPLLFIDTKYIERYSAIIPALLEQINEQKVHRHAWDKHPTLWSRLNRKEAYKPFGNDIKLLYQGVSKDIWNGLNILVPTMYIDRTSVVGIWNRENSISFELNGKPFSSDNSFYGQHLVASVSVRSLSENDQQTFAVPYIPELNIFYATKIQFYYNRLRIEPSSIGLIIDVTDQDKFISPLLISDLMENIFNMIGYTTELSNAGLITRQIITQLGNLQGGRVFKIPGVRRLLRTYDPTESFSKKAALDQIGSRDPENPTANFKDHHGLYITHRSSGPLTPPDVFGYMVEKNIFRIGVNLNCPNCKITSWTALDDLKQQTTCGLCGHSYNAARQLATVDKWHYRRSGIFGVEKNAQGAIPVILTLQQLDTNLRSIYEKIYSPSLKLDPKLTGGLPKCEIDFVWILPDIFSHKTTIILGECKGYTQGDIENLRRVADMLPQKRFEIFILLSKLSAFTPEEIEQAKSLNNKYIQRVILLTARELEPYDIYERTETEFDIKKYASTPREWAEITHEIYFRDQSVD